MATLLQIHCPGCIFDSCPTRVLTMFELKKIKKEDEEKFIKFITLQIVSVFCQQDEVNTVAELSGEMY